MCNSQQVQESVVIVGEETFKMFSRMKNAEGGKQIIIKDAYIIWLT